MRDAGRTPPEVILIALGIFATVAVILYWAAWFLAPGVVQSRLPSAPDYAIYVAFEQSFPLADSWLALASLIGVIGLIRTRAWGFLFMLLAGGAAIFLGLMDLLYDLQYRMIVPLTQESGRRAGDRRASPPTRTRCGGRDLESKAAIARPAPTALRGLLGYARREYLGR